jgi:hypothetical protein
VLKLADQLYSRHGLGRSDAHTLTCAARGITYLPIPPGIGANYAGLMTIDLPATVKRERAYKVVTRQLRDVSARRPPTPPPPPGRHEVTAAASSAQRDLVEWRRVVGAFQITIPVSTKPALRPIEERLLAVLRWIARGIAPGDRWYPVFQRYLGQVAGRVTALGGDPGQIAPSPTGGGGGPAPTDLQCATGKIAALIFDRFGDFEGFILEGETGERRYASREKDLAVLAERAWRERLRVTVCAERHAPHRAATIIVHAPPVPFP